MSELPSPSSTPASALPPPGTHPPKKGMRLGCQILLGLGLAVLLLGGFLILSAVRAKNWFEQNAEATPVRFAVPVLSAEEEAGLEKFFWQYWKAYKEKSPLEISFTPQQFNAFVQREAEKKKKAGTAKPQDPEAFQVVFEGEALVVRFAVPDPAGRFRNFEARGHLSIEDRRVDWSLDEIKLGGQAAPWLALFLMRRAFRTVVEAYQQAPAGDSSNPLDGFQLFRREGERIHLIVDGKKLPAPEEQRQR